MKGFVYLLLPVGWFEWSILSVVVYVYVSWTMGLIQEAVTISRLESGNGWTIAEQVAAFPAFYFGVDPLTGLIFNALLWGCVFAKLSGLLFSFTKKK